MKTVYGTYLLILFLLTFVPSHQLNLARISTIETEMPTFLINDTTHGEKLNNVICWQDSVKLIRKRVVKKIQLTERRLRKINE